MRRGRLEARGERWWNNGGLRRGGGCWQVRRGGRGWLTVRMQRTGVGRGFELRQRRCKLCKGNRSDRYVGRRVLLHFGRGAQNKSEAATLARQKRNHWAAEIG